MVRERVSEWGRNSKAQEGPSSCGGGWRSDRLEWVGGLGNPAGDLCAAASLEKHYCARRQRPLRRKLGVGGGVVTLCPAALPPCQGWHHRGSIFFYDKLVWAGSKIAMWSTVNRILNKDISSIPPRPLDMPSFDFGLRPLNYYCYKVKLFIIGWLNNLISLEPVITYQTQCVNFLK